MTSLEEIDKSFTTSWNELFHWYTSHPTSPYLFIGDYDKIKNIFRDLTDARINRTEFSNLLAGSREEVEKCIAEIKLLTNDHSLFKRCGHLFFLCYN